MELYNLTIYEASKMLRKKEISALELTESVLQRIGDVEKEVDAYLTITSEGAKAMAKAIDERITRSQLIGGLAGIPMAIKDNICTEGIRTTCASKMLDSFIPPYSATVYSRLLEQGAVMLGKTNMDEFAMGSSTENSFFKVTKNPCNIEKVPGGSSGGSTAAVAAGEALFALASETGGSVRQPAAFCGVVGLKPTYGLVSRYGLVAYASSLDQIGIVTKNVRDCAIVLDEIAGHDPLDGTSIKREKNSYKTLLLEEVKDIKIAVPREYFDHPALDKDVKEAVIRNIKKLEGMGMECDEVSLSSLKYAIPTYYLISTAEASSNLARFDGVRYGYRTKKFQDMEELFIKSRSEGLGEEVKRRIMLGTYVLSGGCYDAYYKKAQKVRTLIKQNFQEVLNKYDVIITPSTPTIAFGLGEKISRPMEMYLSDIYTTSVNLAGLPAISIPCGYKEGMPIGMQLIGGVFNEGTLLKLANILEGSGQYSRRPSL